MNLRDNRLRAKSAKNLIIIALSTSGLSLILNLLGHTAAVEIISKLKIIIIILCAITFIQWFRRAYHNIQLFKGHKFRFSEGWASGSSFVHLATWFFPFIIMKDLWANALQQIDFTYPISGILLVRIISTFAEIIAPNYHLQHIVPSNFLEKTN